MIPEVVNEILAIYELVKDKVQENHFQEVFYACIDAYNTSKDPGRRNHLAMILDTPRMPDAPEVAPLAE